VNGKSQNADMDAVYARVSGQEGAKEARIDTQRTEIARQFGPEDRPIYREYLDNPYSGEFLSRPALDKLMADACAGHFNRVLIYHPDRLSRGPSWHRPLLEARLREAGVSVRYVNYQQQDTPEGEMMDQVLSTFAGYERKRIRQRMDAGRARRLDAGAFWWSNRPYGWRYVPSTVKGIYGHVELVPEEAKVVREIFDLVLAGQSAHAIAALLTRRGLLNVSGKPFTPLAVQRIIHNPLYSGRAAINRYVAVQAAKPRDCYTAQRKLSTRERPRADWDYIDLPDRVVSPEEQARAEARLLANRRLATRNAKHPYLLAKLVRCGCEREVEPGQACGRNMYGVLNSKGRHQYRCNRTRANDMTISRRCRGACYADELEAVVWEQIADRLRNPTLLRAQLTLAIAGADEPRERLGVELASAQAAHDGNQAKLTALLRKHLAGQVDDATYAAVQAELVTARQNAADQIAYLQSALAGLDQDQARWVDLQAYCRAAGERLDALARADDATAFAIKRALIEELVTAIWVYPGSHVRIEAVLPDVAQDQLGEIAHQRRTPPNSPLSSPRRRASCSTGRLSPAPASASGPTSR
jgi:site-specific DNA recombinase